MSKSLSSSTSSASSVDPGTNADMAIRDCLMHLYAEPARVAEVVSHQIHDRFYIPTHKHSRLLQLDLIVHCGGEVRLNDQTRQLHGVSAMVAYPGEPHGYTLEPDLQSTHASEVFHVKIDVSHRWPIIEQQALPGLSIGLRRMTMLHSAMRAVVKLGLVQNVRSNLLLARLSEALALWPVTDEVSRLHENFIGEALLADNPGAERAAIPQVLQLIDERLADPPSLAELAKVAHLSPRHFARQFRAMLGCTPHAYIQARRLDQAKQRLVGNETPVQQIATELGFGSLAAFSRWFRQLAGTTPTLFRADPETL